MNSTTVIIGGTSYNGLSAEIDNLIAEANSKTTPRVIVTKADAEVSKTSDGGYYQSALITVTGDPSDNFLEYAVVLDSEDAIIVDENGEKLPSSVGDAQPTYISSTNKFYVRIPVDKVTEEVKKVNVKINGTFADGTLNYYKVADDKLQRMASVSPISVPAATEVEFVTTGDTGMNTAQTIYFIGLIVLLCGVGIVYANAKPVESKQ